MGRNYEATIVDIDASTMTARALLERFTSDYPKNISYFADEAYDASYAAAISAATDEEQIAAYKRCQEILAEQAANIYPHGYGGHGGDPVRPGGEYVLSHLCHRPREDPSESRIKPLKRLPQGTKRKEGGKCGIF